MSFRALVVGGTSGIGYAMACRLAATANPPSSAVITISGRTKPENIPHENIEFARLDASSMRQIKQYTDAYKQSLSAAGTTNNKIDVLVVSQGILSMAGRTETPGEGIDRKMALHYYGRQLIIRELLPVLSDEARVVIVLDGNLGHPSKLIWDDLDLKNNFSLQKAADHCLSMTDAMVQHWAATNEASGTRRHFVHAFPGVVNTSIFKSLPLGPFKAPLGLLGKALMTSPEDCAERLLTGTEARAAEGVKEGRYWSNIGRKGDLVAGKTVWTKEQRDRVVEHTWSIVDAALAVKE